MIELITTLGFAVFWNVVQIIAGCILSIPIYRFAKFKQLDQKNSIPGDLIKIFVLTLCGMLLPMGTFGIIPIFIALYAIGFKLYTLLPFFLSNAVFSMLIPYTDVSFVWKTGIRRVILAFFVAMAAGVILRLLQRKDDSLIRTTLVTSLSLKSSNFLSMIHGQINFLGIYLVAGITFDTLYHKYFWWDFLHLLTSNEHTRFIPRFFAGYNVVNPLFLLSVAIAFILMDFVKTAALFAVFKPKGVTVYYVYLIGWACLLGTSVFI